MLINITAGPDLKLQEVNDAVSLIQESAHEDANLILGAVIDDDIEEEIRITVIATGFGRMEKMAKPAKVVVMSGSPFPELIPSMPDNLDIPAYVRNKKEVIDTLRSVRAGGGGGLKAVEELDYDIPTFLRQPAD
jgi:cell division protein FtsZ